MVVIPCDDGKSPANPPPPPVSGLPIPISSYCPLFENDDDDVDDDDPSPTDNNSPLLT